MTTIAETLIADARGYATESLNNAVAEMNGAMLVLRSLGTTHNVNYPRIDIRPPVPGDPGDVPVYGGSHFNRIDFTGTRPDLFALPDLNLPADPGEPPTLLEYVDPPKPEGEPSAELLGTPPEITTHFSFGTAPDVLSEIQGIQKPAILSVALPPDPEYHEPEFAAVRPNTTAAPPTNLDQTLRTQYQTISPVMRDAVTSQYDAFLDREFPQFRSNMAAIEARLATYLAGGTALSATIEDAIYSRTLDKTNADATRANKKIYGEAARAGFTIPSAILLSQIQDSDQERRNQNARAAIDIAVRQAELEQANLQFAVTQCSSLKSIALNAAGAYYNGLIQINGQALDFARAVVDSIVKVYDIAARFAELQARLYEAEATVYRARLEGALAGLRAYEAKLKGIEAQAEINKAQVESYKARIEAVQAEANVYRSSVEAVVAQAGLEKIKVDLYKARVEGYGAQVSAFTARYQGFEAAVRGQSARISASAETIKAYQARVQSYGEIVRAKTAALESRTRGNESLIRMYATDIEAYASLNRAQAEAVHAEVESFSATVSAYTAKASAISDKSRAEIASYEAGLRSLIEQSKILMEQLRMTNELDVARVTGLAKVAVSAGEVFSAQSQAALAGQNSLASIITESTA